MPVGKFSRRLRRNRQKALLDFKVRLGKEADGGFKVSRLQAMLGMPATCEGQFRIGFLKISRIWLLGVSAFSNKI